MAHNGAAEKPERFTSALAPSPAEAMRTIRGQVFVILDGTLLPIARIPADASYDNPPSRPVISVAVAIVTV
ncbi:hypothetical protein [Streptomyces lavendulae]|uniref:hypothetical protein n=1 Tax=Streptomyces lavendulae TaxID=1914 RepID=UPI003F4CB263